MAIHKGQGTVGFTERRVSANATIQQQAERIRDLEAVVSGFARDIEKCVEACVRAGIGDEHSPEGAVDTLAWQLAEVVEYATKLREVADDAKDVLEMHRCGQAAELVEQFLALPLPKAMQP